MLHDFILIVLAVCISNITTKIYIGKLREQIENYIVDIDDSYKKLMFDIKEYINCSKR